MNSRTNVRARGYSFRVASRLTLTERQPKRIVPVAIFSSLAVNMPQHLCEWLLAQVVRFEQMGESGTPWYRQVPARGEDRSRQNWASPSNRKAPFPVPGPTG